MWLLSDIGLYRAKFTVPFPKYKEKRAKLRQVKNMFYEYLLQSKHRYQCFSLIIASLMTFYKYGLHLFLLSNL